MLIEFLLPVYNEERILARNISMVKEYLSGQKFPFDWKIVVANNGSTDESSLICKKMACEKISVINIPQAGKGRAIKTYGLNSDSDIFVYMDIDLAVSLDNLSRLISPVISGDSDLSLGSRLMTGSETDRSFLRSLSSVIYNHLSRLILRHDLTDLQCGFKAIRTDIFKKIAPMIESDHFFFDTELIAYALLCDCRIAEIPVSWKENRYDQRESKVKVMQDSAKFAISLFKLKKKLSSAARKSNP